MGAKLPSYANVLINEAEYESIKQLYPSLGRSEIIARGLGDRFTFDVG